MGRVGGTRIRLSVDGRVAADIAVADAESAWATAIDRRFERVNRRFCEILGYSEQELIGITGRDISHPDDKDLLNAQRPRLYAGDIAAVRGEKRYLRKDGSVVWVAYTLAMERDAAGKRGGCGHPDHGAFCGCLDDVPAANGVG